MQNKKHLLILCSHFFPIKHIASYRMNAFVKYLDHSKFDITVATTSLQKNKTTGTYYAANVLYLPFNPFFRLRKQKESMPKWKHVLFSINNKLMRYFFQSDYPGWKKRALKEIVKLHNKKKIDFVLSSFSPVDSHLIALEFKSLDRKIKWIADMRDEMSLNQMLGKKERVYYSAIEKKILNNADLITSVSEPILRGFRKLSQNKNLKYLEIRNGFDHEEPLIKQKNETFTFVYAGTFYGKRKPNTFFKALKDLQDNKKLDISWKIIFIGTPKNFSFPKEFDKKISFVRTMSNLEAIKLLSKADCNLLIHPPSLAKGIFTGKLFDYLSVKKPILALVDVEDVAADLIKKCNAGKPVDFYNIDQIKAEILNLIKGWENQEERNYNESEVSRLHRKYQVLKLQNSMLQD